ncbi:sensor histidine kinase [Prauserella halophila]|uniref:histidine kinase n=2 Tax=Prauserella halophila TaxID=185641 RepID=A0ABP4H4L5_9PSEU|nr:histidine kinase [Prauserella halophila]MCP2236748.1 Signal transduction histidine kinase [Prauserella halophila]
MVGDSLIAIVLFALDALVYSLFVAFPAPGVATPPWYVGLPLAVCLLAVVPFRRKYPLVMAYWILVWTIPYVASGFGDVGLGVAVVSCIALYTVVVYSGRRQAALYTALTLVVILTHQILQYPGDWIVNTVTVVLSLALCWVLGEFVGARRAYQAEVEARLHLLENERHQATRIAVAEERERIARELHDVVAHAVSVIVVHADGASYAVRKDPDLAERAIGTISDTGRSALSELRRLLAILRDDDRDGDHDDEGSRGGGEGARTPQPTAADLVELADRIETAGLTVRLDLDEAIDELPAGVSLGVYRIVQEALTNSLKHAGIGTRAQVRVRWDRGAGRNAEHAGSVHVDVDDDGAGKANPVLAGGSGARARRTADRAPSTSGGNGLIGMRERTNVHDGTLIAGPAPGGGWQVRAELTARLGD